jgi:hypothetical protein
LQIAGAVAEALLVKKVPISHSPKFCYRSESTGYSIINELCSHSYGQTNLGHGRVRSEVLEYSKIGTLITILIGRVHKLNSGMFYTAKLGGISLAATRTYS